MPDTTSTATGPAGLPPLTAPDVLALAAIVQAAREGVRVVRVMPGDHNAAGQIVHGTARHIVTDEHAMFPGADVDIRTCMLRVTGGGIGADYFWPLPELVTAYQDSAFLVGVVDHT